MYNSPNDVLDSTNRVRLEKYATLQNIATSWLAVLNVTDNSTSR